MRSPSFMATKAIAGERVRLIREKFDGALDAAGLARLDALTVEMRRRVPQVTEHERRLLAEMERNHAQRLRDDEWVNALLAEHGPAVATPDARHASGPDRGR